MRLFAAVAVPAAQRAALAAALPADAGLRWVPAERWHVTLAFYGEVDEPAYADLHARLARAAARSPALTLRLAGAGTFPADPARARVLWCALAGDLGVLTRLAERASAAGRRAGLTIQRRRYHPHLTLARLGRSPGDVGGTVRALAGFAGEPWQVRGLALVRSRTGPQPRYETLAAWPLGEEAAGYQA